MYNEYQAQLFNSLQDTEYTERKEEKIHLIKDEDFFKDIVTKFLSLRRENKQVFFIGNGGSCAIANHMTADFMKNGKLRCINIFASSLLTCISNDYGYEKVFSRSIDLLGNQGDFLVAISSSGSSKNIIEAINSARLRNMGIMTLSGFSPENKCRQLGDFNIYVPIHHYGIVESVHTLLLQQIVDFIGNNSNS